MDKKIIFFLIILMSLCAISHVSAVDEAEDVESVTDGEMILDEVNTHQFNEDNYTFDNIKNTIESANDGDKIYLNGTFEFSSEIKISKSITIEGMDDGATIKSEAFHVGNFRYFYIEPTASNVILNNLKFIKGTNTNGGAINWQGDNGTINNCIFDKNNAPDSYGGALLLNANNCNITNCTFSNNLAGYGGAVVIMGNNNRITSSNFENNYVKGSDSASGGAIFGNCKSFAISLCNFTKNYAAECGGAIVINGTDSSISGCRFDNNYVTGSDSKGGGAIFSDVEGLMVENSIFDKNSASDSNGGAIFLGKYNTVKFSSFTNNSAKLGHDIYSPFANNVVSSNHFTIQYNETKNDAVYGIYELDLAIMNNFTVVRVHSTISFSAGIFFDYGTASSPILVTVDGGKIDENEIKVLNHSEAKISFKNNLLSVSNLAVGKYVMRLTTIPDENHYSNYADINITVNRAVAAIGATSTTVQLKKGTYWKITLINSKNGKAISKMKISLKVYTGKKSKTINVKTDSKGVAKFKTSSLSKGKHKIVLSASHAGYKFKTVTHYINVIKPTALKFKIESRKNTKKGSQISFKVIDKKTKKGVNGIKVKLKIKTGKKYKTISLKTKSVSGVKGIVGIFTNEFSVGKHIVKIEPASIKYTGSGKSSITIKKSSKKYPAKTIIV